MGLPFGPSDTFRGRPRASTDSLRLIDHWRVRAAIAESQRAGFRRCSAPGRGSSPASSSSPSDWNPYSRRFPKACREDHGNARACNEPRQRCMGEGAQPPVCRSMGCRLSRVRRRRARGGCSCEACDRRTETARARAGALSHADRLCCADACARRGGAGDRHQPMGGGPLGMVVRAVGGSYGERD